MPARHTNESRRGITLALTAAVLFGLSIPCSKLLLVDSPPVLVAGLLYCGSGLGLFVLRLLTHVGAAEARLAPGDLPWLAGAVLLGGVVAPILFMWGLRSTPASVVSLFLNLEGVFTVALAWFVFRESFDRRIALGMALIVAGGVLLSRPASGGIAMPAGALAVVGACLCWAFDNNLTQKVSGGDPLLIAAIKGVVAGGVNVTIAFALGSQAPPIVPALGAMIVGLFGYGISLTLFVLALRHLGTARTGAYFSVAPLVGAVVSLALLDEPLRPELMGAALLMGLGIWLYLTERHDHVHQHALLSHDHSHVHDEHHRHRHGEQDPPGEPHAHPHVHEPMIHGHPHYPDIHHRHHRG
ncbi:MAG TPA: EamA family transporter [Candidatus Polarisedimenticolia bacterium]|nr:EamA family transporter [Candidatus Polarisedimenticolia bacterium]